MWWLFIAMRERGGRELLYRAYCCGLDLWTLLMMPINTMDDRDSHQALELVSLVNSDTSTILKQC